MKLLLPFFLLFLLCSQFTRADDNRGGPPQDLTYCQLVKDPSVFSGKRIRVRAIYAYFFEVSRLKPSACCPEGDVAIWVEFDDELKGSSKRLLHRFPKGLGFVLATFTGTLQGGGPYGDGGYRFKLVVDHIENVEAKAKPRLGQFPVWTPQNCETPRPSAQP